MSELSVRAEFLSDIEALDTCLSGIRLHKIDISRDNLSILYTFISDKTVSDEAKNKIADYVNNKTPQIFSSVEVKVIKIVNDPELVISSIYAFIKNNYQSVSMWLEKSDITVFISGYTVRYKIDLAPDAKDYFEANGLKAEINQFLNKTFCADFYGELGLKEVKEFSDEIDMQNVYYEAMSSARVRCFSVSDVEIIDDREVETSASYMCDATEVGNVILAGTVSAVREKETKNGKPFFIIDFSDTTAKMSGVYFSKKNTVDKIRASVIVGADIIVKGKLSFYKEKNLSLTIDKINLCKFPDDFEIEKLPPKPVPSRYRKVFPEKATTLKVASMFDTEKPLSDEVLNATYVAVDIETTGLNPSFDEITEIAAVKIVNGKISETWTTLIDPKKKLDPENIAITGITDEMLQGKPDVKEVIGDFLLFVKDSVVVGHNFVEFDKKFLDKAAEKCEYEFNNDMIDTWPLSMDLVPGLKKYKLNFVADYFHIEFHHHRALSDAWATAEIFIELMRVKYEKEHKNS